MYLKRLSVKHVLGWASLQIVCSRSYQACRHLQLPRPSCHFSLKPDNLSSISDCVKSAFLFMEPFIPKKRRYRIAITRRQMKRRKLPLDSRKRGCFCADVDLSILCSFFAVHSQKRSIFQEFYRISDSEVSIFKSSLFKKGCFLLVPFWTFELVILSIRLI